jgi:hypothetical protein
MANRGAAFHRLVHAIESATASNKDVVVEAPKRVKDMDTGKPREHDVVLTVRAGHHEAVLAIECRDRSRPVSVPEIEAFHNKCQRTGISRGIIVSPLGFTRTGLRKADSLSIGCLTLEQVEGFNWCMTPGILQIRRDIRQLSLRAMVPEHVADGWILVLQDGTAVTAEVAASWANSAFDQHVTELLEGELSRRFVEREPHVRVITADGRTLQPSELVMDVTYYVEHAFAPFKFRRYFDLARQAVLRDTAIAGMSFPDGAAADLVLNKAPQGDIEVSLVFVPKQLK